jgi:hypothetical protein
MQKKDPCHVSSKSGGHKAHPTRSGFVTSDATDFDNGTLMSAQKARGVADCWGSEQWAWDGSGLGHTAASSTGRYKGFAGGAWAGQVRV